MDTRPHPTPRTVALAAALSMLALGAAGCSGGSSDAGPAKVSDNAANVDATTTTAAPTTTVATTLPPAVGLPDQEAAATRLYDAWFADDKVTASTVADPAAVTAMWKTARGDYSLYNSCSTGEFDTSGCLFRGNLGTIQIDLEKRGANWVVAGAFYSAP